MRQFAGQSLVEANRDLYVWLRDGIPVEVEEDGHRRQINVMVFDWTDPTRNDWLIVNQFTVKGSKTVRPRHGSLRQWSTAGSHRTEEPSRREGGCVRRLQPDRQLQE
ncbi:type I restriction endonuclease [Ferrovum myxofaciens]|uniref:Restriction endonuclease type I HsdR N-terminal domain-containing protein n=1 Tax=Ferrovum myxofaciens TaxID=416213 RepID=A0A9E6MX59_9PROT|nr:type I restriction endonuclease [Ferrovum myxofaciens]QWY74214.1 MAG: hypothetical protein JVY19_10380 [Ferrovum myxofaciens]QWY77983.1 MAG: hypothetical protein JZL65_02540 [Ferrovum myxofaciens]